MQKLDFPSAQLNFSESVTETGSSEPLVPSAQFIRTRSERILLGLFLMSGDNYAYRQPCSYYVMYWMKQGEWFWFRIRSTVTRPKYVQHPTNPGITSHVLDQIHQHTPNEDTSFSLWLLMGFQPDNAEMCHWRRPYSEENAFWDFSVIGLSGGGFGGRKCLQIMHSSNFFFKYLAS